jgi:small subunit ribosomal protein S24e
MNISIETQNDNTLLKRKEVSASVLFEGITTPSRKELQKLIAKETKAKPEMVIIQQIKTLFGTTKAKITAHVYDDQETLKLLERKNLLEKHEGYEPEEKTEE